MVGAVERTRKESGRLAPRYDIATTVQFRTANGDWRGGTTVNIGRLGLLMRTHAALPLAAVLELRVALTMDHTRPGAIVAGCGHVVRVGPSTIADEMLVAVALHDFQLRSSGGDEDGRSPPGAEPGEGAGPRATSRHPRPQ
jgi:hypothetical protein